MTDLSPASAAALLDRVAQITRDAGRVVMDVYGTDFAVRGKDDASPVTEADERAERLILPALAALLPGVPIVAEEEVAAGRIPAVGERFWLVDPLDGTKEFVGRNGEFTVNIALIEHGVPVLGAVFAPALGPRGRMFAGASGVGAGVDAGVGAGAVGASDASGGSGDGGRATALAWVEDHTCRRAIRCRPVPAEGLTVVASRSHGDAAALDAFLASHLQGRRVASMANAGSSLKLCLVAAGEADLYPRLGRTMEWDIAAGHAVLRAAGGEVRRVDDGQPLRYGKAGFENPHFFAEN